MQKIGLAIQRISVSKIDHIDYFNFVDDPFNNYVFNPREYISMFKGMESVRNRVLSGKEPPADRVLSFFSNIEQGCLLCCVRQLDYYASYVAIWIFIPNNIIISSAEIKKAYNVVKETIKGKAIDIERLKKHFSTTYLMKEVPLKKIIREMGGHCREKVGYIDMTSHNICDIMEDRNNPIYDKCEVVFLREKNNQFNMDYLDRVADNFLTDEWRNIKERRAREKEERARNKRRKKAVLILISLLALLYLIYFILESTSLLRL